MARSKLHRRGVVLRACDGDTLVALVECCECCTWQERRLRLARIESWELVGAERGRALVAAEEVSKLLAGKSVTVQLVRSSPDLHGRDIAEVWQDGSNVSEMLVALGFAWHGAPGSRLSEKKSL